MNEKILALAAAAALAFPLAVPAAPARTGSAPEPPVLMAGDSMMRLLGVAMEKQLKKSGVQPAAAFSSLDSGFVRPNVFDWNSKLDELFRKHAPSTVVVAIGADDRRSIEGAGKSAIRYGSPEWEEEYARRVGAFMDRLSANGARRVVWLLLPDMKAPAEQDHARLVNGIVRKEAAAGNRPEFVTLFDLGPVLSRHPGTFSQFVMSNTGAAVAVRDPDGVHLSAGGAKMCARAFAKTFWNI